MSKYKRVSNANENKEKKNKNIAEQHKPSYLDTKTLMEKLGIKIGNEEINSNTNGFKTKKAKETNNITTSNLYKEFNDNNTNIKSTKANSQKKRNKNEKIKNSSFEKRTKKKEQNKKNVDPDLFVNKDKSNKSKINIKEDNYDIEDPRRTVKKLIIKKDNDENNKINKNYKKLHTLNIQDQEPKMISAKSHKMQEETKKSQNIKNIKKEKHCSMDKIPGNKYINKKAGGSIDYKNSKFYCEYIEGDENKKSNKIKKIKGNNIKIQEKEKNNKRNRARSVEKTAPNKRLGLKNKRNNNNLKKVKDDKTEKKSESESESDSDSEERSGFYHTSSYSDSDSDTESNDSENNEKEIEKKENKSSNKKNSISCTNKDKKIKDKTNEEKEKEIEKKESKRSKKRNSADINSVTKKDKDNTKDKANEEKEKDNNKLKKNSQDLTTGEEKTNSTTNKKRPSAVEIQNPKNSEKRNSTEKEKKFIRSNYIRRKSLDNPYINERYEQLMNEMALKQNGGSTLFLKNFEKGPSYQKEIEMFIKAQNKKKKIKISSYTKPGCSGPGIVKTNQDAYFIKENFLSNENYYFIGVCDGHGERGEVVSNYVINKLPEYIQDLSNENITNAFKRINNEIYNNKSIESDMSGTTVISVIITPEKMLCPNLGDSRAVLFKYDSGIYYSKNLSRDHKPGEPDENKRIQFNNGRIKRCYDEDLKKYYGPERVWLRNKEEPGLAMTRSIGDKIAHSVGVIEEPEIKSFEYDGTEKFMIVASDGIWEYLHGEDCIKIVRSFYEDDKNCEEATLALIKEAFKRWKRKDIAIDDITLIVVFFDD
jgi:serine/threonine protein phosphatase PrpC